MSTEQRTLTPEEKIADLDMKLIELIVRIGDLEYAVSGKAEHSHSHYELGDLERAIRDTEYHTHHEYAAERHSHQKWDLW